MRTKEYIPYRSVIRIQETRDVAEISLEKTVTMLLKIKLPLTRVQIFVAILFIRKSKIKVQKSKCAFKM